MHWFFEVIFPSRLHRLAYFLRAAALDIVTGFLCANSTTFRPLYWWTAFVLLFIYGWFFIILPRIYDAGMSRWWLLALFIPLADVALSILLLFRAPAFLAGPSSKRGAAPNAPSEPPPGTSEVIEGRLL